MSRTNRNRKKCINETFVFLPAPSAMLLGIEVAALCICDTRLNFSSFGKQRVIS